MGTGARRVPVSERVVIVILNWFAIGIISKRPEAIQVDLITKARGHGVHQESGGRPLDLDMIGQPISAEDR